MFLAQEDGLDWEKLAGLELKAGVASELEHAAQVV